MALNVGIYSAMPRLLTALDSGANFGRCQATPAQSCQNMARNLPHTDFSCPEVCMGFFNNGLDFLTLFSFVKPHSFRSAVFFIFTLSKSIVFGLRVHDLPGPDGISNLLS